jgi:hypothetical protein
LGVLNVILQIVNILDTVNNFHIFTEVQTYYIRLNITEELGCYSKDKDHPRCYTFTETQYIKQYSNNKTGKFRDMKLRIQVLGVK